MEVVGRRLEKKLLKEAMESQESELIAILGRRRVGKTYLVRTLLEDNIVFEFTGIHRADKNTQLENFRQTLQTATKSALAFAKPETWLEAFGMLQTYISTLPGNRPAVIFFDEFPWIETHKGGFLQAFDHCGMHMHRNTPTSR